MTTHAYQVRLDMINFARNSCTVTYDGIANTYLLQCNVDAEISHLLQDHEADEFLRKTKEVYTEGDFSLAQAEYLIAHEYLDLLLP